MNTCTFDGDREITLVAYVYDEIDAPAKAAFELHLGSCALCLHEVTELQAARVQLKAWQPPDSAGAWPTAAPPAAPVAKGWWRDAPIWAQAAAAVLILGIGAGAANLHVSYGANGLLITTGWLSPSPAPTAARTDTTISRTDVATRAELETLARQVRSELDAAKAASAQSVSVRGAQPAADTLKQMRALVSDSERRQERELALRVAELVRDVQGQREADLARIDRNLGILQNNTGAEVMRQRQMINSLAVRVSQRQ